MKKFEAIYPVDGTSALQLDDFGKAARGGAIIEFPGAARSHRTPARAGCEPAGSADRAAEGEPSNGGLSSALRGGDVAGKPFGRMSRWQAAAGGFVLSALAFAGLFLAL